MKLLMMQCHVKPACGALSVRLSLCLSVRICEIHLRQRQGQGQLTGLAAHAKCKLIW